LRVLSESCAQIVARFYLPGPRHIAENGKQPRMIKVEDDAA
jgi:hypothetical protein